ncbi:squalene synthase HpnC [Streptomyces sp. DSM 42041]|uniref:Squalene synthase HpnC n=1 Tax=Streptomyces hazeniae TaxID=3075538 RepID=A0ABU2NXX3_9ACTN|nr:squalene synthase HpnC [Streptomyces sp. DSM 42041]MDT0381589.1 squalene synthase HpnC [Streptomyces sp. DSM 42041]
MTAQADARTRAVLDKAAHENFPVAPRMLPKAWRRDLMAVYGYARLVDDIGDGDLAPGGHDAALLGVGPESAHDRLALLDAFEADLYRALHAATGRPDTTGAGPPRHPLLAALVPTVRAHALGPEPFLGLIEANRQDQKVRRYETLADLERYCELSANPVGRLVLAVTGTATPERLRHSDAVCTGLQIVEHLQDVAEDLRRDRVYLPARDMRRFGVTETDLAAPTAGAPLRALIAFECERGHRLLDQGTPLVRSVRGRLRLLLAGYVGGGRAALAAIRRAGHDVLPGPPAPTKAGLLRGAGAALRREG